jgi:hypothetical protein
VVAALAVGGVLLAVMIAASGYAAIILPEDARIPLHFGSHEHVFLMSKRAGLVIWPALGAVLFGVLGGVSASSLAADWVPGVRDVLMPAVMCVVLGFQVGALVLAAQDQGSDSDSDSGSGSGSGSGGVGVPADEAGTTARSEKRSLRTVTAPAGQAWRRG